MEIISVQSKAVLEYIRKHYLPVVEVSNNYRFDICLIRVFSIVSMVSAGLLHTMLWGKEESTCYDPIHQHLDIGCCVDMLNATLVGHPFVWPTISLLTYFSSLFGMWNGLGIMTALLNFYWRESISYLLMAMVSFIWKKDIPGVWVLWSVYHVITQSFWTDWLWVAVAGDVMIIVLFAERRMYTLAMAEAVSTLGSLVLIRTMNTQYLSTGMIIAFAAGAVQMMLRKDTLVVTHNESTSSKFLETYKKGASFANCVMVPVCLVMDAFNSLKKPYFGIIEHVQVKGLETTGCASPTIIGRDLSHELTEYVKTMPSGTSLSKEIKHEGLTTGGFKAVKMEIAQAIMTLWLNGSYAATVYRNGNSVVAPEHAWSINDLEVDDENNKIELRWNDDTKMSHVISHTHDEDRGDGWVFLTLPKEWQNAKSIKPHGNPSTNDKGYLWLVRANRPTLMAVRISWTPTIIAHDGSTLPGDSGAPITDENGNILAVHNGYLKGSQLNAAVPPPSFKQEDSVTRELVRYREELSKKEEMLDRAMKLIQRIAPTDLPPWTDVDAFHKWEQQQLALEGRPRNIRQRMANKGRRKPMKIWSDAEYEELLKTFTRDELKDIADKRREEYDWYEPEAVAHVTYTTDQPQHSTCHSDVRVADSTRAGDQVIARGIETSVKAVAGLPRGDVPVAASLGYEHDGDQIHEHVAVATSDVQGFQEILAGFVNTMKQWQERAASPASVGIVREAALVTPEARQWKVATGRLAQHCPDHKMGYGQCANSECPYSHRHHANIPVKMGISAGKTTMNARSRSSSEPRA